MNIIEGEGVISGEELDQLNQLLIRQQTEETFDEHAHKNNHRGPRYHTNKLSIMSSQKRS